MTIEIYFETPGVKNLILGNVYKPPWYLNDTYQQFIDEFIPFLATLGNNNRDVVIAGDFNINLLKIHEKPIFSDYFDAITAISFLPKITLPTRFSDHNGTLIDNFLCKLSNRISQASAGILMSRISDHLPYFISLDYITIKKIKIPKCIQITNQSATNIANFKHEICIANILDKLDLSIDANPNINYNILEHTIVNALKKHLPTKTVKYNKYKHKKSGWMTNGLLHSIQFRDKQYMKIKKSDPTSDEYVTLKTNLCTYNRILRNCIRIVKTNYYHSTFNKYRNDIKSTWSKINEIMRRGTKSKFPESFLINETYVKDNKKIADEFNSYFSGIGNKLASDITRNDTNDIKFDQFLNNPCTNDFTFRPISIETTVNVINKLASKNSRGHDGISTKLLKLITIEISETLTIIINQSLYCGIFPDNLKLAKVIPIFKKGNNQIFDNYRPISILPAISKIFERIIYEQLYEHFILNNLFYPSQYGFKRNHSCELAVLEVIDRIIQELDKGRTPINIYLDLSKAFDTLNHDILIHKLKFYGITGRSADLLQSYLSNRKQYVQLNNVNSKSADISVGVPQGSILGPLLCIIYINDIIYSSNLFKFTMYADDTTLFTTLRGHNQDNMQTVLINDELSKISNWLIANRLSLNVAKTKFMVFSMPQKKINIPLLRLANSNIECVDSFNFWELQLTNTSVGQLILIRLLVK